MNRSDEHGEGDAPVDRTRREESGGSGTVDRTRREGPGGSGTVDRTRREGPGGPDGDADRGASDGSGRVDPVTGRHLGRVRTVAPDALLARFEVFGELGDGAEAVVLLVAPLDDPDARYVLKLYRRGVELKPDVLERLSESSSGSEVAAGRVARLLDHGCVDGEWWELHEYLGGGSLQDWLDRSPGGLGEEVAERLVGQLVDALGWLHERGLTHRDVKPSNILLRSADPLDVVLADFGVAMVQDATIREASRHVGTVGYQPPESLHGNTTAAYDLWSFGAVIHHVLTGRQPMTNPDGSPMSPGQSDQVLFDRHVPLDALDDQPRWQHLVRGLLQWDATDRFGLDEVRAWRRGELPPLPESVSSSGSQATDQPSPFRFNGQEYATPRELLAALNDDWNRGVRAIGGTHQWAEMTRWFLDHLGSSFAATLDQLDEDEANSERRLIRLTTQLAPDLPAQYRGHRVDDTSLQRLVGQVLDGDDDAASLLATLYRERLLKEYQGRPGCTQHDALHEYWYAASGELEQLLDQAVAAVDLDRISPEQRGLLRARLLQLWLEPGLVAELAASHDQTVADIAREVPRIPALGSTEDRLALRETLDRATTAARLIVVTVLHPVAQQLERDRQREAEQREKQREQQRREREQAERREQKRRDDLHRNKRQATSKQLTRYVNGTTKGVAAWFGGFSIFLGWPLNVTGQRHELGSEMSYGDIVVSLLFASAVGVALVYVALRRQVVGILDRIEAQVTRSGSAGRGSYRRWAWSNTEGDYTGYEVRGTSGRARGGGNPVTVSIGMVCGAIAGVIPTGPIWTSNPELPVDLGRFLIFPVLVGVGALLESLVRFPPRSENAAGGR